MWSLIYSQSRQSYAINNRESKASFPKVQFTFVKCRVQYKAPCNISFLFPFLFDPYSKTTKQAQLMYHVNFCVFFMIDWFIPFPCKFHEYYITIIFFYNVDKSLHLYLLYLDFMHLEEIELSTCHIYKLNILPLDCCS